MKRHLLSLLLIAAVAITGLPSCQNATPRQKEAATAAGVAALNTVVKAYAEGGKVNAQVAAQAAQAALQASTEVLSAPVLTATDVITPPRPVNDPQPEGSGKATDKPPAAP